MTSPWSAKAAGDVSDHIEQLEDVGAGDHCTSLGPDKGLANAKCLNGVDALCRTNGQAVHVCPRIASLMKILSTRVFNEPTDSLSLASILFVGESYTFLISSDAVFIGALLTTLRINSCLSCVRNLAWSVA